MCCSSNYLVNPKSEDISFTVDYAVYQDYIANNIDGTELCAMW